MKFITKSLIKRRDFVLFAVATGWFLSYGIRMIYPVLVEYVRTDFQISNTIVGLLFSLLMVTYALMQFPSGILADRLGERRVLLSSLVITTVGVVLLTVSPVFVLFALGCIVFGVGTGLYSTPQFSILLKVFPDRSATVHGFAYAAGSIGTFILPVIAGYIAIQTNWRIGFGFGLPFILVALIGLWRVVPDQDPNEADVSEFSLRRTVYPIVKAINSPTIITVFGATVLVVFPFQGITAFLPAYLISVKEFTSLESTLLFGLFFVTGTISQIVLGNLADRSDRVLILLGISVVCAVSLLLMSVSSHLLLIALLIVPLSTINAYISLSNTYLIEKLPDDSQGGGLGLLRTCIIGIGALSPVSLGFLIDRGLFNQSLVLYAVLISSASVLCLYLRYNH